MNSSENLLKRLLPVLIAVAIVVGIIAGNLMSRYSGRQQANVSLSQQGSGKIDAILDLVERQYVDKIKRDSMEESLIPKLLEELDPHSVYIPASDLQAVNEELDSSFGGIGVQFNIQDDTVMVMDVISGGPSERVGIHAGDRIVSVNDTVFVGKKISNDKVMKKLRGPKGTKVKVGVVRNGIKGGMNFEITRGDIPVYSVDVSYIIKPGIGYIKVSKFSRNTYSEFLNALCELKALEAKSVIVDLRGNQGGFLDQAVQMINEFMNRGDLIVYTQGKSSARQEFRADGSGTCKDEKLIILIDEWSASASEIFSGAIQDNDRGLIIGRRSFGKGLVQNQFPISDGSAVRLTIARYYTPSGRCIQKSYGDDKEDYYKDIFNRYMHGEMDKKDSIKLNGEKFKTKSGRLVYGGGGIMPDIFVPIDTTGMTPFFNKVVQKGLIYSYAFKYTDRNREILKSYQTFGALNGYLNGENLYAKFVDFCFENGVNPSDKERATSKMLIESQLKAYISRNILDNKGFYPALLPIDETLQKALEILSGGSAKFESYLR